jgi:hypothetical protein
VTQPISALLLLLLLLLSYRRRHKLRPFKCKRATLPALR